MNIEQFMDGIHQLKAQQDELVQHCGVGAVCSFRLQTHFTDIRDGVHAICQYPPKNVFVGSDGDLYFNLDDLVIIHMGMSNA